MAQHLPEFRFLSEANPWGLSLEHGIEGGHEAPHHRENGSHMLELAMNALEIIKGDGGMRKRNGQGLGVPLTLGRRKRNRTGVTVAQEAKNLFGGAPDSITFG